MFNNGLSGIAHYTAQECYAENVNQATGTCSFTGAGWLTIVTKFRAFGNTLPMDIDLTEINANPPFYVPQLPSQEQAPPPTGSSTPEFGSFAGLVIAISIIGVVLMSRRFKLHFFQNNS